MCICQVMDMPEVAKRAANEKLSMTLLHKIASCVLLEPIDQNSLYCIVLYCIDFVVLSSNYGEKKDILRKKKTSLSQFLNTICFKDTRTHYQPNKKLFIMDRLPEDRYEPISNFNRELQQTRRRRQRELHLKMCFCSHFLTIQTHCA